MKIDVTGRSESFDELSALLSVDKFGILDEENDWSYIGRSLNGDLVWGDGIDNDRTDERFPSPGNDSPATVTSKIVWIETGEIEIVKVVKVLAYLSPARG